MERTYLDRIPFNVNRLALIYLDLVSLQKLNADLPDDFWIERARIRFGTERMEMKSDFLSIPEKYLQIAALHQEVGFGSERHISFNEFRLLVLYRKSKDLLDYLCQVFDADSNRLEDEIEDFTFLLEANNSDFPKNLEGFFYKSKTYSYRPTITQEIYNLALEHFTPTEDAIAFLDLFDYMKAKIEDSAAGNLDEDENNIVNGWDYSHILSCIASTLDVEKFEKFYGFFVDTSYQLESWMAYFRYYANDDPEIPEVDGTAAIMFCCFEILLRRGDELEPDERDIGHFEIGNFKPGRIENFLPLLEEKLRRDLIPEEFKDILKLYRIILGKEKFSNFNNGLNLMLETYMIRFNRVDLMEQSTWSPKINRYFHPEIPIKNSSDYMGPNSGIKYNFGDYLYYYLTPGLFKRYLDLKEYNKGYFFLMFAPNEECAKLVYEKYLEEKEIAKEKAGKRGERSLPHRVPKIPEFKFLEARRWYESLNKKP